MTPDICQEEKTGGPDFKSWGEEQIARLLEREGIRYQYEYPLVVVDGGKQRLYYPDFRLPDQGIVIEYFGLNGNKAYDEQMRHKLELYGKEGIEGLFLTRDSLRGDWPRNIMGQIDEILEKRARQFRERSQR